LKTLTFVDIRSFTKTLLAIFEISPNGYDRCIRHLSILWCQHATCSIKERSFP
jgi:hypothetical protein